MSFKFLVGQAVEYTPIGGKAAGLYKITRQMPTEERAIDLKYCIKSQGEVYERNVQQASQHPRTGEGGLQMQPVETSHDCEVGGGHRTGQVIDAAPTDAQDFRLLCDWQIVLTVDHRFALSNPALVLSLIHI